MVQGLRIASNTSSLMVQRQLSQSTSSLEKIYQRLSSGKRINNASDDSAGLAIAQSLNANGRIYGAALRNVNDGISALNIVQGALNEISSITSRQQELAEQAANGAYNFAQRRALDKEADALTDEFNRIVGSTEFNGRHLLDLSQSGELRLQAGLGNAASLSTVIGGQLGRTVGTGSYIEAQTFAAIDDGSFNDSCNESALADIDNDGDLDMVVAGYLYNPQATGGVSVYENDGAGNFAYTTFFEAQQAAFWAEAVDVSLSDLNGDGFLDMAVAGFTNESGTTGGAVSIFLNNGTGGFNLAASYAPHSDGINMGSSRAVSLGDLNGDGAADMVVAGYLSDGSKDIGSTYVFLNNGSGSFTLAATYSPQSSTVVFQGEGVELADLNGDGSLDMAVAGTVWDAGLSTGWTAAYLNNGQGGFTLAGSYLAQNSSDDAMGQSLAIADLNGDGFADLAVGGVVSDGVNPRASISTFLGNGTGGFSPGMSFTTLTDGAAYAWSSIGLSLADLNGDGVPDLSVLGCINKSLTSFNETWVYLNDGSGGFALNAAYEQADEARGWGVATPQAGDLNGDGAIDLLLASTAMSGGRAVGEVSILQAVGQNVATVAKQDLTTRESALAALSAFGQQSTRISAELGTIGASMSRTEAAAAHVSAMRENFAAATSRIMDADVAQETAALVRTQILQQAGSAILAQANQSPQLALSLLKRD